MSEDIHEEELDEEPLHPTGESLKRVTGMYKDWFLDYASYVILERAVPALEDGFKPVQRRILHSLKDLDDGRYNKVANVVGHTMQYHPHGDASIGDAMVQLGQKDLLIDTQGNWGNILTGDSAAAPRYIEARLSKFALQVVYSPKVTEWQLSYDGRKKEPINLPVKFPLLLAQGADGIAVGLSTKVLPHNFNELIDASISYLKGRSFSLLPDFPTAGIMDAQQYQNGNRGGKIRLRCRIEKLDRSTLLIKDIPYGTNTGTLIDSIIKANEKGKIKIKKIEDNTAAEVAILIHLPSGISPEKTIDALYAFTACESSISPMACVIHEHKPRFMGVDEILRSSTDRSRELLGRELEIRLSELEEQWHFASLERIFIENRIYRDIEEEETWEGVLSAIRSGLEPHIGHLRREITEDDLVRLTEIRIKRISKFDRDKAQQHIDSLEESMAETRHHLENLTDFTIDYFRELKKNFGKGRERKTEIRVFDDIEATRVVLRTQKLYVNREEGFVGTALKKDTFVSECSDIDDVIVITRSGNMMVTRVDSKVFIEKDILHVAVFRKRDKRTVYNMIYKQGQVTYIKRFHVTSVTRDRMYPLAGIPKTAQVLYLTANPNGEAETVTVHLRQSGSIKKLKWDIDFSDILIKGRDSRGNIVSKHPVKRVEFKESGHSTLKPRKLWFDEVVGKLNTEGRGELLGEFRGDDQILWIEPNGTLHTSVPNLLHRFEEKPLVLEKWNPEKPISIVYYEGERGKHYIKRFLAEAAREEALLGSHPKSRLEFASYDWRPRVELHFIRSRGKDARPPEELQLDEAIDIKGIRALGNQLSPHKISRIQPLEPLPYVGDDASVASPGGGEDSADPGEEENQARLFD